MGSVALEGFGSGGGASLNFKVVGNPQPTNPKENTIWVNTDVEIPNWYFSATQPENMQPGEVWISTGTSSTVAFNALKKGGTVMVYPISAKQMGQDGVLVDVTAKSWQNGAWVDWIPTGALYYKGNECEPATGGWGSRATGQAGGGWTPFAPSMDIIGGKMTISFKDTGAFNVCGVIETKKEIDVTNYSHIVFDISDLVVAGTGATMTCVAVYKTGSNPYDTYAAKVPIVVGDDATKIDVSGLEGGYAVGIFVWQNYGTTTKIVVDEVICR